MLFRSALTTAAGLVNQLMEARDEKRMLRLQRELAAVRLLIVDELGYVPLSPTGAELLFEVFSQRYERGSTLVTSNLPFEEWTSVFGAERLTGLRDTVPVGSALTMKAGSAAQVLLAWEDPDRLHRGLRGAVFSATDLSAVRRRGWAQSIGEREAGIASVSAPIRGVGGKVLAAVSISGPIERLTRQPGRLHGQAVAAAAARICELLAARNPI